MRLRLAGALAPASLLAIVCASPKIEGMAPFAEGGVQQIVVPVTPSNLSDNGISPFISETWGVMTIARHSGAAALYFSPPPPFFMVVVNGVNSENLMTFSVVADGVLQTARSISTNTNGLQTTLGISTPPGTSRLEIWAPGTDAVFGPPNNGTPLYSANFVTVIGATPAQAPQPAHRFVGLGDSILMGKLPASGAERSGKGYVGLARALAWSAGWRFGNTAYGSRTLVQSSKTPTQLAGEIAAFGVGATDTHVWIELSLVDYVDNSALATFATDYGALLDQVRLQVSGTLFIHCQLAIPYPNDTGTNGNGNTLAQFRSAISTAQSTRSSYARVEDPSSVGLAGGDFDADQTHLAASGETKMGTWLWAELQAP